ncbi:hypothetical protein [Methanobrevibacter sp.]|uniref:hypothetical protein n=1 Tax=Methanobrevibacter sp. TaxID=66852 RepID=UPI00388DA6C5
MSNDILVFPENNVLQVIFNDGKIFAMESVIKQDIAYNEYGKFFRISIKSYDKTLKKEMYSTLYVKLEEFKYLRCSSLNEPIADSWK